MASARSYQLECGDGARVSLTHYAAEASQPPHAHDFLQLSFLLAGTMGERIEGRAFELHGPACGYKPAGSVHENRWGREGVLVFSITLPPLELDTGRRPGWSNLRDFPIGNIVRACFSADPTVRAHAIGDAFALTSPEEESAAVPRWLATVRDQLTEEPDSTVEAAARSAGVDRAHLSRAFRRCFGVPPSVHRRRVLAARSLQLITRTSVPLAHIAHDAGFSDHSHMSRTLRSDIGLPPSDLRNLLKRDITSIQDRI